MVFERDRGFRLEVPLDASGIEGFLPDRAVKVLAIDGGGRACEATARFDAWGKGTAALHLAEVPGNLRVLVGPGNASTEQLWGLETLRVEVPASRWRGGRELRLEPIVISARYWWWWLRWCRRNPRGEAVPRQS